MIVVTGATGNIGRPLVETLVAAGEQVTAVSRHRVPVPDGAQHVTADLGDAAGLASVLDGAEGLFVLLSGDLHAPEARPGDIIAQAAASGVGRVVLLSSQGVQTRPHGRTRILMRALEDALRDSGVSWSVLRPGGFASNALAWSASVRDEHVVHAPFGDVGVPVVDPTDIGEVAAACLTDDRHSGRIYTLTGPAVITPRQQAEVIGNAVGAPVGYRELSRAEAKGVMVRHVPAELAEDTLDIIGAPLPSELAISPDVGAVLGRPARSFADWVAAHVDAFR